MFPFIPETSSRSLRKHSTLGVYVGVGHGELLSPSRDSSTEWIKPKSNHCAKCRQLLQQQEEQQTHVVTVLCLNRRKARSLARSLDRPLALPPPLLFSDSMR